VQPNLQVELLNFEVQRLLDKRAYQHRQLFLKLILPFCVRIHRHIYPKVLLLKQLTQPLIQRNNPPYFYLPIALRIEAISALISEQEMQQ
jgi:hypothetical protein